MSGVGEYFARADEILGQTTSNEVAPMWKMERTVVGALLAIHGWDPADATLTATLTYDRLALLEEKTTTQGWLSVDRLLGLLSTVADRPETTVRHFEAALAFCRDSGMRPELAWTCSDYAKMLLARDTPGAREKATELQDEAIAIAQELGMQPLLERMLAQREILKA